MKEFSSNESKSSPSWTEQKSRMEDMLARLKSEIKEVKTIDKELTRQFIQLGGMINELKSSQEEDDYDDEYVDGRLNSSITEEENQEANGETDKEKKDSCDDTKL